MRVYHSSKQIVEFPAVRIKKKVKDFSWGFYCSDSLMATRLWAMKKHTKPIINIYEYQENANLNVLQFEKMTDEWLDFILKCRRGFVHHYDVVIGPLLDETVKDDVEAVLNGTLSREDFWEKNQLVKPISQMSFHTIRALRYLKYVGSEELY